MSHDVAAPAQRARFVRRRPGQKQITPVPHARPANCSAQLDRARLLAAIEADRGRLPAQQRQDIEDRLAMIELSGKYSNYTGMIALIVANRLVVNERYDDAWHLIERECANDHGLEPWSTASTRLLEILLDVLRRGVAATADRIVRDVELLIRAGYIGARDSLLDRLQLIWLTAGREDESLALLKDERIDPVERIKSAAVLLDYARPNVLTLVGGERVVAGADRLMPHADAIAWLWRRLPTAERQIPLGYRSVVVWAMAATGGDVAEPLLGLGPEDGHWIEQICRWLRWFEFSSAVRQVAEAARPLGFAENPTPAYLVLCLDRLDEAVDRFMSSDDLVHSYVLLSEMLNVPAEIVPRLVGRIDWLLDLHVNTAGFSLDLPGDAALIAPRLLPKRAYLAGTIRPLPLAPDSLQPELRAFQAKALIELALARDEVTVAAALTAELPADYRDAWMRNLGGHFSEVPSRALTRMLLALPAEIRVLAIISYLEGLADREVILNVPLQ
jgi:hypothetical protein